MVIKQRCIHITGSLIKPLVLELLLIPTQVDLLVHLVIQLLQFPLLKHNNLKVVIAVKHRVLSRISLPGALRMVAGLWSPQGGESRDKFGQVCILQGWPCIVQIKFECAEYISISQLVLYIVCSTFA